MKKFNGLAPVRIFLIMGALTLVAHANPKSIVEEQTGKPANSGGDVNAAAKGYTVAAAQSKTAVDATFQEGIDKVGAWIKTMSIVGADKASSFADTAQKQQQRLVMDAYMQQLRIVDPVNFATNSPVMNPREAEMIRQMLALVGGDKKELGLSTEQKLKILELVEKYLASGADKDKAKDLKIDLASANPDATFKELVQALKSISRDAAPADLEARINSMLEKFHGESGGGELSYLAASQRSKFEAITASSLGPNESASALVAANGDTSAFNRLLELGLKPKVAPEVYANNDRAPASMPVAVDASATTPAAANGIAGGFAPAYYTAPVYYGGGLSGGVPRDVATDAPITAALPIHPTEPAANAASNANVDTSRSAHGSDAAHDFPTPASSGDSGGTQIADRGLTSDGSDSTARSTVGVGQPVPDETDTAAQAGGSDSHDGDSISNIGDAQKVDDKVKEIFGGLTGTGDGISGGNSSHSDNTANSGATSGNNSGSNSFDHSDSVNPQCAIVKPGAWAAAGDYVRKARAPTMKVISDLVKAGFNPFDKNSWGQLKNSAFTNKFPGIDQVILHCPMSAGNGNNFRTLLWQDIGKRTNRDYQRFHCLAASDVEAAISKSPKALSNDDELLAVLKTVCSNIKDKDDEFFAGLRSLVFMNHVYEGNGFFEKRAVANAADHGANAATQQIRDLRQKERDNGSLTADEQKQLTHAEGKLEIAHTAQEGDAMADEAYWGTLKHELTTRTVGALDYVTPSLAGAKSLAGQAMSYFAGPASTGTEVVDHSGEVQSYDAFNVKPVDPNLKVGTPFNHVASLIDPTQAVCSAKPTKPQFNEALDFQSTYKYAKNLVQSVRGQFANAANDRQAYLQASAVALNQVARSGRCMPTEQARDQCVQLQYDQDGKLQAGSKVAYQFLNNLLDYTSGEDSGNSPVLAASHSNANMGRMIASVDDKKVVLRPGAKGEAESDAADMAGGMNNLLQCAKDPKSGAALFLQDQEATLRAYVAANCQDFYAQSIEEKLKGQKLKVQKDLIDVAKADDPTPRAQPMTRIAQPSAQGLEGFDAYYRNYGQDNIGAAQTLCKAMRTRYRVVFGMIAMNKALAGSWLLKNTVAAGKKNTQTH